MSRIPRVFVWIVVLCCLIEFALEGAAYARWPLLRQGVFMLGGFWPTLLGSLNGVYPGQGVLMFLTYGFLHAGPMHLAMNMLSLLALVREMAGALGTRRLLVIYIVSQIAGAALFGLMVPPQRVPMVGASGAIFGLAGALFGFALMRMRARGLPLGPLARSALLMVGLNLILTLAMPNVAWQAHLGGALAGLALGLAYGAMAPPPRRRRV